MKTDKDNPETCMACGALSGALSENVRARPYVSLAAAFGAGYVLGGGLNSRTTMRVLNLGFKVAMLPFVQDKLLNAADVVLKEALKKTR
jgi:hypothetical protein